MSFRLKVTVPGHISGLHPELEQLIFRFENVRRRVYRIKWKGVGRLEILRQLTKESGLPARYVNAAYDSIKALPPHVTFGGKQTQRFRQGGKLSHEEYRLQRHRILICRGEKARQGNLCLRIKDGKLRITVGRNKWIWLPIHIPKKYQHLVNHAESYTVLLKRRPDLKGYEVRITIKAEVPEIKRPERVMALDINSGHVDFSVADKETLKPVAVGKVDCHELLDANKGKRKILLHLIAEKVTNIARHYGAEVFAGKLHASYTHGHRFNRRVQGMNQFQLRQILEYKLPMKAVSYTELSEAYTSKLGTRLSKPLGLDVHKAASYAFAIKAANYPFFKSLLNRVIFSSGVSAYEGDGIPSTRPSWGSPQTVA